MSRLLLISPSGNLYGSEQVLLDYLRHTEKPWQLYVPEKGGLIEEISKSPKASISIQRYNPGRLTVFYLQLLFKLMIRKCDVVYINEAGHNRYILLLARIFPKTKFLIHVRLLEDAMGSRWPDNPLPANITLIAISGFIRNALNKPSALIYDLYRFTDSPRIESRKIESLLRVGIIGRLTPTKGINLMPEILTLLSGRQKEATIEFHFFGEVSADMDDAILQILNSSPFVHLHGVVNGKTAVYSEIDAVLHLSGKEPLGRIFLEAIDEGLPFIGINGGGIQEIGEMAGLSDFLVQPGTHCAEHLLQRVDYVQAHYDDCKNRMNQGKDKIRPAVSPENYVASLESLF